MAIELVELVATPSSREKLFNVRGPDYRDRLLPDIFRMVLKDLGVTGSQGEYNRQHRKAG